MDKIKGMLHGHKKDGEEAHHTGTGTDTGMGTTTGTTPGYGQTTGTTPGYGQTTTEGTGEKKHGGLFGLGGHKKEGGKGGSSSSSSSDEEREGARERNRIRRERRAQKKAGGVRGAGDLPGAAGTTTVPMEGTTGEKKHGFFG